MSTLTKYLLLQIPGWIFAILILVFLYHGVGLPRWVAIGLFALWVVKDLVMYPLLRTAYESGVKTGVDQLIGARGVAQTELSPRGYVRVRGELWQAEVRPGELPVAPGSPVTIVAAEKMTLIVKSE